MVSYQAYSTVEWRNDKGDTMSLLLFKIYVNDFKFIISQKISELQSETSKNTDVSDLEL